MLRSGSKLLPRNAILASNYVSYASRMSFRGLASSTVGNSVNESGVKGGEEAAVVYPMSTIAEELNKSLQNEEDLAVVYSTFQSKLSELRNSRSKDRSRTRVAPFARSYYLNEPLGTLLEKSSNSKSSAITPYQILSTLIDYKLAKPKHFEIVMRHLFLQKEYKDVIALWIKYLEIPLPNMRVSENERSHSDNSAFLIVSYLNLPDVNVDYNTVKQILQQNQDFTLPLRKIRRLIVNSSSKDEASLNKQLAKLDDFYRSYVDLEPQSLIKELDNIITTKQSNHLFSSYQWFKNAYTTDDYIQNANIEIIAKFMEKFVQLEKNIDAIAIFNDFKAIKDIDNQNVLKRNLLLAVSKTQNNKNVKLDRILAIWNSLIKPNLKDFSESQIVYSYQSLFGALNDSNNATFVKEIYENELTNELKDSKCLYECYLSSLLQEKTFTYSDFLKTLDASKGKCSLTSIESTKLINDILMKLVLEENFIEFDKVYSDYFTTSTEAKRKPTLDTIVIKLYSNYKHHMLNSNNEIDSFDFLKSISQTKQDYQRVSLIFQRFVDLSSEIGPISEFFNQINDPIISPVYSSYIKAQFSKQHGKYETAELAFTNYIKEAKSLHENNTTIGNNFIIPMLNGLSKLIFRYDDVKFVMKLPMYLDFAEKLDFTLKKSTLAVIVGALSKLTRTKTAELTNSQRNIIKSLVDRITDKNDFKIDKRDLETFKKLNGSESKK